MTRPPLVLTLLVSVAIAIAIAPRPVRAQVTAEVSTDQARAHFEFGVQLIQQGRWSDAVAELEAARAIHVTAPVLYNLGIGLRGVGRLREAVGRFNEFLEMLGAEGSRARRTEVQGYISELTASLGMLHVSLQPPNATVFIDGERMPDGTTERQIDPGSHRVRAELAGYVAHEEEVEMERGGTATVSFMLEARATQGTLVVDRAIEGAEVTIDGTVVGSTPYEGHLDPGTHTLAVRADGYRTLERPIEIVVGELLRVQADLVSAEHWFESPWLWLGVGVVVVGTALGVAIGFAASGTEAPYQGRLGLAVGLLEVRL